MIYITRNFPAGKGCLKVYAADGTRISELGKFNSERFYEGYGCGNGTSASGLATQARNAAGATTIYVEAAGGACYGPIPNPASRHDRR